MKTLKLTSQFKKDLKRYKHRPVVLEKLERVLAYIVSESAIPKEHLPHPLTGDYKGYMECHIESDTLLIWYDQDLEIVKLIRFGTHSELFGKGLKK